jgi:ribosomal protein L37AE/L43A
MSNKIFTENQDNIVCPHCGYEHDYEGESEPFFDCHNCKKEFAFSIEMIPQYSSKPLKEYLEKRLEELKNSLHEEMEYLKLLEYAACGKSVFSKGYKKSIEDKEKEIIKLQEKLKLN